MQTQAAATIKAPGFWPMPEAQAMLQLLDGQFERPCWCVNTGSRACCRPATAHRPWLNYGDAGPRLSFCHSMRSGLARWRHRRLTEPAQRVFELGAAVLMLMRRELVR